MIYLLTTIFLILGIGILTIHSKFLNFRKRYIEAISFGTTLIATFIGVFLAIYFNNLESHKREKSQAINLLNAASNELNQLSRESEVFIKVSKTDTIDLLSYLVENNLPFPKIYFKVLESEIIIRSTPIKAFNAINESSRNLYLLNQWEANNLDIYATEGNLKQFISIYHEQLKICNQLIELGILLLDDNIDKAEFDESKNLLNQSHIDELKRQINL